MLLNCSEKKLRLHTPSPHVNCPRNPLTPGSGIRLGLSVILFTAALVVHAAAMSDLESARRSLSAARDAIATASVELRTSMAQGGLTQVEVQDHRAYLARLNQLVVSNCRMILGLKKEIGDTAPEPGCDPGQMAPAGPVSFPQERTEIERTTGLDSQLGASLSEFDELLLREMDALKRSQTGSPDAPTHSGSGGSQGQGAGASGGLESADMQQPGAETQQQGSQQPGKESQEVDDVAARSEQNGQQSTGYGGSRESTQDTTRAGRRDQPPGADDDDIVARQLREAAENELDPELREKLWEEYRRYKANQTVQSKN